MTQSKLLRIKKVSEKTGLPKTTIYEEINKNIFPKQISLGKRTVAWVESEIDDWIKSRIQKGRRKSHE